ncbi:MAG TPA: hypothetical protein VNX29_20415 [Kaistia sp.]|nr:hypothetical protein [Kaistia sp.]
MLRRNHLAARAAAAILALAGSAFAQDITFTSDMSYPESVTYSAKQGVFLLGSVTKGLVAKVDKEGTYTPFITDVRLVSTVGLLVDDHSNTLWVTSSDPGAGVKTSATTQGRLAAVATYDATTGARKAYYDLGGLSGGAHFANDIALDADGNAYVTDSFAPVIYKIDAKGKASIFAENPIFLSGKGFNLNGIAWHEDGYLLVGKYNSGELFRVSTKNPTDIRTVKLPEPLVGADGIHLIDGEHLLVVQNAGADRTVELTSNDGWMSASIVRTEPAKLSMPTAATTAGDAIYILNARLDTLLDPKADKVGSYLLQQF